MPLGALARVHAHQRTHDDSTGLDSIWTSLSAGLSRLSCLSMLRRKGPADGEEGCMCMYARACVCVCARTGKEFWVLAQPGYKAFIWPFPPKNQEAALKAAAGRSGLLWRNWSPDLSPGGQKKFSSKTRMARVVSSVSVMGFCRAKANVLKFRLTTFAMCKQVSLETGEAS